MKPVFLNYETLTFSVDEIFIQRTEHEHKTWARLIPCIESIYFHPRHTRFLSIEDSLVEDDLYIAIGGERERVRHSSAKIRQGWTYTLRNTENYDIFEPGFTLGSENFANVVLDQFESTWDSDFRDRISRSGRMYKTENTLNEVTLDHSSAFMYCFNVGQGDSFLLITGSKNAYLIDTNIYSGDKQKLFESKVAAILKKHCIAGSNIKGLIITHKHLDHLRGADQIIMKNALNISNLLINLDYHHPTTPVINLLSAADVSGLNFINCNREYLIQEGSTFLSFVNPTENAATKDTCPDINDSSICLCVRVGNDTIAMTGDVSYGRIMNAFGCIEQCKMKGGALKISHHGSRTGTDDGVLGMLIPSLCFISAGKSKRYNHPHDETKNFINEAGCDVIVTKNLKCDFNLELTGRGIRLQKVVFQDENLYYSEMQNLTSDKDEELSHCYFSYETQAKKICPCVRRRRV